MEGFPSGQREQTVNLSSMTSVVRIHHLPPKEPILIRVSVLFWCQVEWIRKPALRNVPVARFNRRGFRRNGSESTTGRVGRRVAVRLWDCTSQSRQARAINGASALRNVPVARFNHRGFRRNGSESTTGRAGTRVAVRLWDCTSQSRQARAQSEGKNRLFDGEINLHRLFGTIYCRLRRYPVGAHSVRQGSAKSYGSWANTPTR